MEVDRNQVTLTILQAIERGEGSGENWEEYRHRLVQAESDALTFQRATEQALNARQVRSLILSA